MGRPYAYVVDYDLRFYAPRDDQNFRFTLWRLDPVAEAKVLRRLWIAPHDPPRANRYEAAMRRGDLFPPIVLLERHHHEKFGYELEAPEVVVEDGRHRLYASRASKVPILAWIGRERGAAPILGGTLVDENAGAEVG